MGDEIGSTLARRFPQYALSQAAPERVAEYREILKELEEEVLAILEACEGQ
jgi:hypothetical protein